MTQTASLMNEVFEKAGGRKKLLQSLPGRGGKPLSKQALTEWVHSGVVPVRHVPMVHRITGIPMERLNPAFAVIADEVPKVD